MGVRSQKKPANPAATIAATCARAPGTSSTTTRLSTAIVARFASGVRVLAMPSTACATTATAAALSPWIHPASDTSPSAVTPHANATSNSAEGRVNAVQAATKPASPARCSPSAMPTWLDAGPGRNWHSAIRSAYAASSSHLRRSTNASLKYPRWATGPPKAVTPSFRNAQNTSATVPGCLPCSCGGALTGLILPILAGVRR